MTSGDPFELRRAVGDEFAAALMHERIDAAFALKAQTDWKEFTQGLPATGPVSKTHYLELTHGHWNWYDKVLETGHLLPRPTLAVECEGQAQGLMLIDTAPTHPARLSERTSESLVYIISLSAAPWNLGHAGHLRRFRGVGPALIRAAVLESLDLGYKGRIGLHSLQQSETFYARLGFTDLGSDPAKRGGLKYYELSAAAAAQFVA